MTSVIKIREPPSYTLPSDIEPVDILICESTYGYNPLYIEDSLSIDDLQFLKLIQEVLDRQGIILIPAFAIGRSQEIILILKELIENKQIPKIPIYVDGLSVAACHVYENSQSCNKEIFSDYVRCREKEQTPEEVVAQLKNTGGIIIASSGMLLPGSKSAEYAEFILPDKNNMLLITGYQDEENPGYDLIQLCKSSHQQKTLCIEDDKALDVNASVYSYRLSAHAAHDGIIELIEMLSKSLKQVIFVHGDCKRKIDYQTNILNSARERFGETIKFEQAKNGEVIELWNRNYHEQDAEQSA